MPDVEIAEDHVQANKKEGHLEGETKEGDAYDRKKGQLPDAEKAKDCPEGSKEQQEDQPPATAQSTPNQEEEAVGDFPFLARQATLSIPEDVPTFNLGFDSTQKTLEEVIITSLLSSNIAEMAIDIISADNKDKFKKIDSARVGVYLLNNQLDKNDIKSLFNKCDDHLHHKEFMTELVDNVGHWFTVCLNLKVERFEEGLQFFHVEVPRAVGWQANAIVRSKGHSQH
ncbi:hypothetical protein E2562_033840 [Oryza meyeriana var. granulata]|uniref:Uncharacterized protein n=1 Tax=Oryza meyeriana var. granulata TaxID=110450 RepID=A0A6G1BQ13_9ORYZ|nr:hypothetical protein E2562_033840 [Oryza meyeriana var. granulata]